MSWDAVVARQVAQGARESQMFGVPCLKTDAGKVFASDWHGELVVKLARERVDAMIGAGEGSAFEPMAGRAMKEWVIVRTGDWDELADEARRFVSRG